MLNVTIDEQKLTVEQGSKIVEVAKRAGIYIPNLCCNQKLIPFGCCRLCIVEVKGNPDLVTACVTEVEDGMEIYTENPRISKARKTIVQLLLLNHPLDCLVCDRGGDCRLQDLVRKLGITDNPFTLKKRITEKVKTRAIIEVEPNKCMHCGMCVRVCDEVRMVGAIDFYNRGFRTGIGNPLKKTAECELCGECMAVCPVSGLSSTLSKYETRPWEVDRKKTTCPYCGCGCTIVLHMKQGKVVKFESQVGLGLNDGSLCAKGRFGYGFIHNPERLTTPLIKKAGKLTPVDWEEALDFVAQKLLEITKQYGGGAVGAAGSARSTNEDNYILQKFMRAAIKTDNIDSCARQEHLPSTKILTESFGTGAMTAPISEISKSDVIFVIGSNTTVTHSLVGIEIKRAVKKNAAKLIVIDPRKTVLAQFAHSFLQLEPGTDVTLLNGIMSLLLNTKLAGGKSGNLDEIENFKQFMKDLLKYKPSFVEEVSGVPSSNVSKAADILSKARKVSIVYGTGVTKPLTGEDNVRSIVNLSILVDNLGKEGSGIFPLLSQNNTQGILDQGISPGVLPGYQQSNDISVRKKFEKVWGVILPEGKGLSLPEMLNETRSDKVKAMYVMGSDLIHSFANPEYVKKALSNLEFLVVQDIFLNETAEMADVVLPAASFAEKNGTFTNMERRIQQVNKGVSPPGKSKSDWKIICEISTKMGYNMAYSSADKILDEISGLSPIYAGVNYSRLGDEGIQWPCPEKNHPGTPILYTEGTEEKLKLKLKLKFNLVQSRKSDTKSNGNFPFRLIMGSTLFHHHQGNMTRRSKGLLEVSPDGYLEINPLDATKKGFEEDEKIEIISACGSLEATVKISTTIPAGTVFLPRSFTDTNPYKLIPFASSSEESSPDGWRVNIQKIV